MGFMASQLSFMFENLNKTVVITGSQIPISEWRNDAESNLIGAFTVAEHRIPEVVIFFNGCLLRGNRTCKESSTTLNAFGSPNYPALATFDVFLNYRQDLILKPPKSADKFQVFKLLERRIALIYVHPLITSTIFLSAFKKAKAIVLQTYGIGNFPLSRVDLVEIIEDAILKYNKTVVIVSQCRTGFVRSTYASSVELVRLGVTLCEDMTVESVIAKLSYVMGKGYKGTDVKKMLMTDLRGEISVNKAITGKEEESANLLEFMSSLFGKSNESDKENLNTVSQLLQPLILQRATKEGSLKNLSNLVSQGADINSTDKNGTTALHVAVMENNVEIVQFLVEQSDINLHIVDDQENSPLYYACLNGFKQVAEILIQKDALFITDEMKLIDTL